VTTPTDEEPLLVHFADGVLRIQLNRPKARNAINWAMRRELHRILGDASNDNAVRVVVLAGDERAFCSGGDVKQMGGGDSDTSDKLIMMKAISETVTGMLKPVVAEVRGHAAGAGFGLALMCDLVLADETAVFTSTFIRIGLVPDLGLAYWLPRQVGLHRAKEIILTGRPIGAHEALALGLVARVWATDTFRSRADEFIAELSAQPGVGMGLTKPLLNQTFETSLSATLDSERLAQITAAHSHEHQSYLAGLRSGSSVAQTADLRPKI
jgi:2-(1,2-epoxy-1,2-dihydrophenyl)acetyl-CoA isomerase